ncbi:hypothetical protein D3C73_1339190 [compost metagenome]
MDVDLDGQVTEIMLHQWLHLVPLEITVPTPEFRERHLCNPLRLIGRNELGEASLDPFELGRVPPVEFGGEVEYPIRRASPQPKLAGLEQVLLANPLVGGKHLRLAILERLRQTFAHHPDTVDGVDQRLGV